MPSVFIKTYGCQMNERDSEAVAAQLVAKGYSLAASEHVADVVLLNTCSVRDNAEQTALGKMAAVIGAGRKQRPGQVFGFLGCMAQSRGKELIDRLPDVDLVLGTQKFHRAAEYLDELLAGKREHIVDTAEEQGSEGAIKEHLLNGAAKNKSVTAFVSIMQGCNQYCTFCIVPYTRGEEMSRPLADVLTEVADLALQGVKEVTLLGQNVNAYRGSMDDAGAIADFATLVEHVAEMPGIERIRYTTSHPKEMTQRLIDAYRSVGKLVSQLHLPAQSGSDRILAAMKRGYTALEYKAIVRKLRAARPGLSLSTDLIVGFPGETDEDFERTMKLVEDVRFDGAFIFLYSPRPGTPAAELPDPVPRDVAQARLERLQAAIDAQFLAASAAMTGTRQRVLVTGRSTRDAQELSARTDNNRVVNFAGEPALVGRYVDVVVTAALPHSLRGELAA